MEPNEFYTALKELSGTSYKWNVSSDKTITAQRNRGADKGQVLNPITVLASYKGLGVYNTSKRDTLKAGRLLGLTRTFTENAYHASVGSFNRGNVQVVRGKIKSALEI